MRTIRIFVSSPSDVDHERRRIDRVVERLRGEFAGVARIETVRWETHYYSAHDTFQNQIPQAADCDIVVALFWSRLGSELPPQFPLMEDGEPYPSGTAYEVLTAIRARQQKSLPDVFVFKKNEVALAPVNDSARLTAAQQQWGKLQAFFKKWFVSPQGHFLAAFQQFETTDEFERQFEDLLRQWLAEHMLQGRTLAWPIETKGSPFRGLAPFGAKHASMFFGRDRDVARATDALKDAAQRGCPFLLIVGASGSGKSSLVRAGLVSRLTTPGVVPAVDVWRVATMRPSEAPGGPVAALAARLFDNVYAIPDDDSGRPAALPELAAGDNATPKELADLLDHADASAARPLVQALERIGAASREAQGFERRVDARLLLVVDQLDELFGPDISVEDRSNFAKLLAALAATGRVWIVGTLRADLYERFLQEPHLLDLKTRGSAYDLAPPGGAELAEIVRKPAEAAGLTYGSNPASGETLDERLLRDADRSDMLPLVQFALNRLFEERQVVDGRPCLTVAAYDALGGLDGAIDKEAERALATLGETQTTQLPRLLRLLAQTDSSGSLLIRTAGFEDAANDDSARELVQALTEARILMSSGAADGTATVRLAHQRVLTSWARARDIVAASAEFYRIRDEVEAQCRRWEASKRKTELLIPRGLPLAEAEKIARDFGNELPAETHAFIAASGRRARLQQRLVAGAAAVFAVLFLAATAGGIMAWRARQEADAQRIRAEKALAAATGTANGLIFNLAERFRNTTGVPVAVIKDILDRARALQDQLTSSGSITPDLQLSAVNALDKSAQTLLVQGDTNGAYEAADRSLKIMQALVNTNPDNTAWQRELAVSSEWVGDVLKTKGNLTDALRFYRNSLAIREHLTKINPGNAQWQRDLSISHERIGDVLQTQGNLMGALESYRETLTIRERLAQTDPGDARSQNDLSISYERIGDALKAQGNLTEALKSYRDTLAIHERFSLADPNNAQWQRDLASCYERIGDLQQAQGDLTNALKSYRDTVSIFEHLAKADPGNTQWQRDLSISTERIGDVLNRQGNLTDALKSYRDTVAIFERLAKADPRNSESQRDLALGYERIGNILKTQGDLTSTLESYRDSFAIHEHLTKADPSNAEWQRDLAISYERIGDLLKAQGNFPDALRSYRDELPTWEDLVKKDSGNSQWLRGVAISYDRISDVLVAQGKLLDALQSYRDGVAAWERLMATNPDNAEWQGSVVLSYLRIGIILKAQGNRLDALKSYRNGLAVVEHVAELHPDDWRLLTLRALSLFYIGDVSDPSDARAALTRALVIVEPLERDGRLPAEQKNLPQLLRNKLDALPK